MWWSKSSLLFDFFLECLFLLLSVEPRASLRQTLLDLWTSVDISKHLVRFSKKSCSESAETNLHNSSVINNLKLNWLFCNSLRNMRVHQQVLGLKVPIVNGVMEALEKSSLELTLVTKVIDNQFYNVSNFLH